MEKTAYYQIGSENMYKKVLYNKLPIVLQTIHAKNMNSTIKMTAKTLLKVIQNIFSKKMKNN